jgi:hypothetical protein
LIQISFLNRNNDENDYLGSVNLTLNEMLEKKEFELKNNITNMPAGMIRLHSINIIEKPTFVEYLRSGWQINL